MLTIVTVNFNGSGDTLELMRSLERQSSRLFDVVIVDNDSEPLDREQLAAHMATSGLRADVIHSDRNRGFAGGCNLGIRKALAQGATWVVLLNNDTTVGPDFIERLSLQLKDEPAVVGIPLEEGQRTTFAGRIRWLASTAMHLHAFPVDQVMTYAIGGGVAIHEEVFQRAGMLDERYFLYFEDAEYSMRARHAGFPIRFLEAPSARHKVSASTARLGSPLLLRYHMRNAMLLNATWGPWYVRLALPGWALFSMVKQLVKLVAFPERRAASRAITLGIIDFYANHTGKLPDDRHRM